MPELPDVEVYVDRLLPRVVGETLIAITTRNPFVLRTVTPSLADCAERRVAGVRRLGKRIVVALEGGIFVVIHLMIAGRLSWRERDATLAGKTCLAALRFSSGLLLLTEAGSTRRASIHVVGGEDALTALDPGGIEVLSCDLQTFARVLTAESHTLKRSLTDPRLFSGIGNAYSDEILHRARLSPVTLTGKLTDLEIERLFLATTTTLREWTTRLKREAGDGFPAKVTAFRPEMAVHGRFGKPCPDCGTAVQRLVYASKESNYCARCQTGGKLLADRALSRLMKRDWPRTLEELEERKVARREPS